MKKENIVITDNFLPKEQFADLRDIIIDNHFPWFFLPAVAHKDEDRSLSPGQFIHMIYFNDIPTASIYETHFISIMEQLGKPLLARIKMNLACRLPEPFYSDFHVDIIDITEDTIDELTTSILYINTNNGYTEFEDGTKVKSVANRFVTFPANTKHRGVSQTDEQTRIVINFNYFELARKII